MNTELIIKISNMVSEYTESINADEAKCLLNVTIMPLVCTVIEDMINEGKIKLC